MPPTSHQVHGRNRTELCRNKCVQVPTFGCRGEQGSTGSGSEHRQVCKLAQLYSLITDLLFMARSSWTETALFLCYCRALHHCNLDAPKDDVISVKRSAAIKHCCVRRSSLPVFFFFPDPVGSIFSALMCRHDRSGLGWFWQNINAIILYICRRNIII